MFLCKYPFDLRNHKFAQRNHLAVSNEYCMTDHGKHLEIISTEAGCMNDMKHNPDCSKAKGSGRFFLIKVFDEAPPPPPPPG